MNADDFRTDFLGGGKGQQIVVEENQIINGATHTFRSLEIDFRTILGQPKIVGGPDIIKQVIQSVPLQADIGGFMADDQASMESTNVPSISNR